MGAQGHFDLEASQAVLKQLATACRKRGIHQALLDVRALQPGAKPVFSPKDLVALVETFDQVGFKREDRVAVLYGADPHHRASLFSFAATVHGWQVQAFKDFERAVFWLAAAELESATSATTATETTSRPKRVPVRQLKSLRRPPKPAAQPVIQIKSSSDSRPVAEPVKPGKIKPSSRASVSLPR